MYKKYEIAESYSEHIYFVADTDIPRFSLVKENKLPNNEVKPQVIALTAIELLKLYSYLKEILPTIEYIKLDNCKI